MNKRMSEESRKLWEPISYKFAEAGCRGRVDGGRILIVEDGVLCGKHKFSEAEAAEFWGDGWEKRIMLDLDDDRTLYLVTSVFVENSCWAKDADAPCDKFDAAGHSLGTRVVWTSWQPLCRISTPTTISGWRVESLREKDWRGPEPIPCALVRFDIEGENYRDALVHVIVTALPVWKAEREAIHRQMRERYSRVDDDPAQG